MEPMISNRYSRIALVLLLTAMLAVAIPATAVTVSETTIPDDAEAGEQISATITLDKLYQDPQWEPWTLAGETELENVTWTLTFIDQQGNEFHTETYNGQTFNQTGISTDSQHGTITKIRVEVTGDVPEPEQFTYAEPETFVVAELTQVSGEQGAQNSIDTWEAHHYTSAAEGDPAATPGSKEARDAIESAEAAIAEAEKAGADVSSTEGTIQNAISAYENGNFANAVSLAEDAESEAEDATAEKEQSQQRSKLLLFGGGGLFVVVLIAGGFWYYRQQQDTYDKLG